MFVTSVWFWVTETILLHPQKRQSNNWIILVPPNPTTWIIWFRNCAFSGFWFLLTGKVYDNNTHHDTDPNNFTKKYAVDIAHILLQSLCLHLEHLDVNIWAPTKYGQESSHSDRQSFNLKFPEEVSYCTVILNKYLLEHSSTNFRKYHKHFTNELVTKSLPPQYLRRVVISGISTCNIILS